MSREFTSRVALVLGVVLVLLAVSLGSIEAAPADTKIGDITVATGDVMMRTKGAWVAVTKVPQPMYETDKLATKKGRAMLKFVDGGELRVDTDSSVSVTRQEKSAGILSRKKIRVNVVNVVVGNMTFEVKVKKENTQYAFKTPSMTAAVRGTIIQVAEDPIVGSQYALLQGQAEAEGQYQTIQNPQPITESIVYVPPTASASARENSPAIQLASAAVAMTEQAQAATGFEKAKAVAESYALTVREVQVEAKALKDIKTLQAANQSLGSINQTIKQISESAISTTTLNASADRSTNKSVAAIAQGATKASENAANMQASIAAASVARVLAVKSGNDDSVKVVDQQMQKLRVNHEQVNLIIQQAMSFAQKVADPTTQESREVNDATSAQKVLSYVNIVNSKIDTVMAASFAETSVALQTATNDAQSLVIATQTAEQTNTLNASLDQTLATAGIDLAQTATVAEITANTTLTSVASTTASISTQAITTTETMLQDTGAAITTTTTEQVPADTTTTPDQGTMSPGQ